MLHFRRCRTIDYTELGKTAVVALLYVTHRSVCTIYACKVLLYSRMYHKCTYIALALTGTSRAKAFRKLRESFGRWIYWLFVPHKNDDTGLLLNCCRMYNNMKYPRPRVSKIRRHWLIAFRSAVSLRCIAVCLTRLTRYCCCCCAHQVACLRIRPSPVTMSFARCVRSEKSSWPHVQ